MTAAKHTPGPWRYDHAKDYCGELISDDGDFVCTFSDDPSAKDAALIAAAPDLLNVLRELVSQVTGFQECNGDKGLIVSDAIEAIAKATGAAA